MARTAREVDPVEFQALVEAAEAENTFPNLGGLWKNIADKMGCSTSFVIQKAAQFGTKYKTQPGKKGRQPNPEGKQAPKKSATVEESASDFDVALLVDVFAKRGIVVKTLDDVLTSGLYTREENRNVRLAWYDLRRELSIPNEPMIPEDDKITWTPPPQKVEDFEEE